MCFNGGCLSPERHHARTHFEKTGHAFTLNVKRKLKPSSQRVSENSYLSLFLVVHPIIVNAAKQHSGEGFVGARLLRLGLYDFASIDVAHIHKMRIISSCMELWRVLPAS